MAQMGYIYYNPSKDIIDLGACVVNCCLNFVSSHLQLSYTQMVTYNLMPYNWFPFVEAQKYEPVSTLSDGQIVGSCSK